MAVKEWFRRLRPVQLYVILFLTAFYFIVELVMILTTHSLTLLLNGYHMLCNIVALVGYIASIKYENESKNCTSSSPNISAKNSTTTLNEKNLPVDPEQKKLKQYRSEKRIKNTFGWARIDVVTMLICCVLLASFCYSLIVEAVRVLCHMSHQDAMHHQVVIFCIGAAGILLNGFCYFLIGGYTFNQGVFLHFTKEGDVVLKRNSKKLEIEESEETSAVQPKTNRNPIILTRGPGFSEICRDMLGCVFVMIAAAWIYYLKNYDIPNSMNFEAEINPTTTALMPIEPMVNFTELSLELSSNATVNLTEIGNFEEHSKEPEETDLVKSIDAVLAIVSAVTLFVLSYPYMKESIMILLQTIPNHINIESLRKELLAAFPDIVNVHEMHVWQLNGAKVVATVHIIYRDPMVFAKTNHLVTAFFMDMGITHVTIQPEFSTVNPEKDPNSDCLILCQSQNCSSSRCCEHLQDEDDPQLLEVVCDKFKSCSKEVLPTGSCESVSLRGFSKTDEDQTDVPATKSRETIYSVD